MTEQTSLHSLQQLTIAATAQVLGVCEATVYNLLARGELRSTGRRKLRRIPIFEIERWQRAQIELNELERQKKVLN